MFFFSKFKGTYNIVSHLEVQRHVFSNMLNSGTSCENFYRLDFCESSTTLLCIVLNIRVVLDIQYCSVCKIIKIQLGINNFCRNFTLDNIFTYQAWPILAYSKIIILKYYHNILQSHNPIIIMNYHNPIIIKD